MYALQLYNFNLHSIIIIVYVFHIYMYMYYSNQNTDMTDELDSILGQYSVCPKSSEWEERMEERESNWSDSRP